MESCHYGDERNSKLQFSTQGESAHLTENTGWKSVSWKLGAGRSDRALSKQTTITTHISMQHMQDPNSLSVLYQP